MGTMKTENEVVERGVTAPLAKIELFQWGNIRRSAGGLRIFLGGL